MVALRREGLVVEAVHDEVLVFNPGRSEATALNQSAARVFELCDGTHSVDAMRTVLEAEGLGPSSDDAVWLALSELAEAGLIDIQVLRPSHLGRRDLIKQFGVGAAALSALPVVESIRAPAPDTQ
ncbi:MAG: PqqD family protein, partial [Ilumatobacter sp.]|nr:PqqD family protein [Ilumatobacter sp.]